MRVIENVVNEVTVLLQCVLLTRKREYDRCHELSECAVPLRLCGDLGESFCPRKLGSLLANEELWVVDGVRRESIGQEGVKSTNWLRMTHLQRAVGKRGARGPLLWGPENTLRHGQERVEVPLR